MKDKFTGQAGHTRLVEALLEQRFVEGNIELAEDIAADLHVLEYDAGSVLIEQNAQDDDLLMILTGTVQVLINGKHIATRYAGQTVGEMSAVNPLQKRSATVIASEPVLAGRISEAALTRLADGHPRLWRFFAKDLARRLLERNKHVGVPREKIEIFIISSVEALPIARAIQTALDHDPYNVVVWTDGVFRAGKYTLENLEGALATADFAVAIAQPDEEVSSRDAVVRSPRDNVIFEVGYFMGRLGRQRAILFEPRGDEVELPSDLTGVTTILYRTVADAKYTAAAMAPACNQLRELVTDLGPLGS
ncbi:TIR domain-containing protein [Devosia sp. RR2S18]|uniref:TIR domain-containing protein n=1 Tax=Devosia rhizosphaerae TaxID=3049774 RepID=UPI0025424787|nr:TIR domain-containing protein [Devosia sp. RR2S18]WIJ25774.1 nucleotide-binding protein [Devosia sp. RR2S18]